MSKDNNPLQKTQLKAFDLKKSTMLIALVGVMIIFQALILSKGSGDFFSPSNISNLIGQNSYVLILATGMLLCILTGGNIDLSVGSGVCLVSAIAGVLIVDMHLNIYLSIAICLLCGTAMGALQAYFIAYMRIPPFIVTLAGMLTFRGIAYIILNGMTISPFPENYVKIFNGFLPGSGADKGTQMTVTMIVAAVLCAVIVVISFYSRIRKQKKGYPVTPLYAEVIKLVVICAVLVWAFNLLGQNKGIPVVLITLAVIILAYNYFTSKTVPGRHLYALGSNEKAAIFSGINTKRSMFFAYTNMGFLVAVAALVCVARFNSASPAAGTNYELDAIGACFIGGASAYGGTGTVGGTVIGAVLMGVLNNGMSILGIDANWQRAVKGVVLLLAVIIDVTSQKRRGGGGKGLFGGLFNKKKDEGVPAPAATGPDKGMDKADLRDFSTDKLMKGTGSDEEEKQKKAKTEE
ncbi:MAG: sugar ABC transporter permease [Clostridiales Family XIII bacterium]|jgi:putative multiple sugar transport system permease protein|nr:sugar ABC transporter permease [Clostridiales Family XIII bacterium]